MMTTYSLKLTLVFALLAALACGAQAQMLITVGGVAVSGEGFKTSYTTGVFTETFNARPTGNFAAYTNSAGTYSNGSIANGPIAPFGGDTSNYITPQQTGGPLSFVPSTPLTYFGMYWATRDTGSGAAPVNNIRFFTGAGGTTLLQSITPGDIGAALPINPGAFVNFTPLSGAKITKIEWHGEDFFDSDNHAYSSTFSVVPEPGALGLLGLGALAGAGPGLRRRRV